MLPFQTLKLCGFVMMMLGTTLTSKSVFAVVPDKGASPVVLLPKFHESPWFTEQTREMWFEPDVRVVLNAPLFFNPALPTRLILYATPNGNTIEQTLGSAIAPSVDWHFDIQHIAAQTRRLREVTPHENIVLAVIEAEGLSWPAWRARHPDNASLALSLVENLRAQISTPHPDLPSVRVALTGHSGGGSFIWGFINSAETIPDFVDCIAFLDANYSYSDTPERHGDKLLLWLNASPSHHLVVIAYDDRNITLEGKRVVGPNGGTFRASQRMKERFQKDLTFSESQQDSLVTSTALQGRLLFHVHLNPDNKILHTALVGEMNGFLEAMTHAAQVTPQTEIKSVFRRERSYTKWVQAAAVIPERPQDALGGAAFLTQIATLKGKAREAAIAAEILRGNIPPFLRRFQNISVTLKDNAGQEHNAIYQVMPDYLAVGSDSDFVRFPMTPQTAQRIADAFGCSLPTRKMVNDIHQQAALKLSPQPLTEAREATTTFGQHNTLIEEQRAGHPLGLLVSGIKKDVVLTNLLALRPNRVAIYGWHQLNGQPIQPLTTIHHAAYVDYSHGVRLVKRAVIINNKTRDISAVLHSPQQSFLLSDEGPLESVSY